MCVKSVPFWAATAGGEQGTEEEKREGRRLQLDICKTNLKQSQKGRVIRNTARRRADGTHDRWKSFEKAQGRKRERKKPPLDLQ